MLQLQTAAVQVVRNWQQLVCAGCCDQLNSWKLAVQGSEGVVAEGGLCWLVTALGQARL